MTQPYRTYKYFGAAGLKRGDHVRWAGYEGLRGTVTRVDSKQEWADVRWEQPSTGAIWSKRVFRADLLVIEDAK